jgi:hypothetical protein
MIASRISGMIASTLVLVALALTGGCVGTSRDPDVIAAAKSARDAFMECAFRRAGELSGQSQPAEKIATAAIASCGREEATAFEAIRMEARDEELALAVIHRLRVRTHEGLIDIVVTRRAKK